MSEAAINLGARVRLRGARAFLRKFTGYVGAQIGLSILALVLVLAAVPRLLVGSLQTGGQCNRGFPRTAEWSEHPWNRRGRT